MSTPKQIALQILKAAVSRADDNYFRALAQQKACPGGMIGDEKTDDVVEQYAGHRNEAKAAYVWATKQPERIP